MNCAAVVLSSSFFPFSLPLSLSFSLSLSLLSSLLPFVPTKGLREYNQQMEFTARECTRTLPNCWYPFFHPIRGIHPRLYQRYRIQRNTEKKISKFPSRLYIRINRIKNPFSQILLIPPSRNRESRFHRSWSELLSAEIKRQRNHRRESRGDRKRERTFL